MTSTHRTKKLTVTALLSAVCVVSRIGMTWAPNIKPVTTIIILLAIYLGTSYAIETAFVSSVVAGLVLGLGTFIPFQILGWVTIAALSAVLAPFLRKSPVLVLSLFSAFCGYLYGFVVSWERLLYVNFKGFIVYYIAGLPFDTLHAVGNFAFCLVMTVPLRNLFLRERLVYQIDSSRSESV